MRIQPRGQLFVRALSRAATRGVLLAGGRPLPCALGRSGRRVIKREGDGATPSGTYALEAVFYRRDRGLRPPTGLPLQVLTPTDGWCDEPTDRNYNRRIRHPYAASAEKMWRQDGLYDLIVVLDCNRKPLVRGRGSAIFIHLARPGLTPTEGCIALRRPDLLRLLAHLRRGARVHIP